MFERKALWDTEFFRFSQTELTVASTLRAWLANSETRLGKFLASVEYHSKFEEFSYAEVRELEARIVAAYRRKAEALLPLQLLRKIVCQLNRLLQLSIPQPTLAIQTEPLINPLVVSDVSLAHNSVHVWLEAEKTWLSSLRESADFTACRGRNVPFELLLFSAALHGGIVNQDLAFALHAAMLDPSRYVRHSTIRGYVDLPVAWHGKLNQEIRRWYPDEALLCLIARLTCPDPVPSSAGDYSGQKRRLCEGMTRRIVAELLQRGVPVKLLPRSLADLYERIIVVLRSEMPAVFVGYAAREIDARSPLAPSIDLIYGDPGFTTFSPGNSHEEADVDTENPEGYGGDSPDGIEPVWMASIRGCFGSNGAPGFHIPCAEVGEPDSVVARRIIGFAKMLTDRGSSSGHRLKPNSVKCCVLTVARRLGGQLCERDPAVVSAETLEDLYVNAIDQAAADSDNPPRLQSTVAWALREFHRYLRRADLASPLNESDVFRVPRGFLAVDATIVSIDDVDKALDYLLYEPNPSWSDRNREIARVCILLGYFAGLRTMEGIGALRRDFPGGPLLPFRVVASQVRGLKTPNATRSIFMSGFISPFEKFRRVASAWSNLEEHDPSSLLFDGASDDLIIPMINQTLRAVTGNDRVRYYNLRHSFASWTITRLLLSELPLIPDMFPHLPLTTVWLQHSMQFRLDLYGNDLVDNDHAWAVATLMGHSRPNVSLANYCHTLDILLPEFLRVSMAFQAVLSHRARLRLSSFDAQSSAYAKLPACKTTMATPPNGETILEKFAPEHDKTVGQRNDNAVTSSLSTRDEERKFALNTLQLEHPGLQASRIKLNRAPRRTWFEQTSGLLSMAFQPRRDAEKLVEHLGLTVTESHAILNRAIEICALRSVASNKTLHTVTHFRAPDESEKEYALPSIPRSPALKLASELAFQIERSVDKHEDTAILLEYYSRNVQPNSAAVIFRLGQFCPWQEPVLVERYRRLLGRLNIQMTKLRYYGCDGTRADYPRVDWYPKWGLRPRSTCRIVNLHGKRATAIAPGEWLSIAPECACRDSKRSDRAFFDGFRYAMLLAAIRFGKQ